jgi:hypothetical protein
MEFFRLARRQPSRAKVIDQPTTPKRRFPSAENPVSESIAAALPADTGKAAPSPDEKRKAFGRGRRDHCQPNNIMRTTTTSGSSQEEAFETNPHSQLAPTEGSFLSACPSTTIGIPRNAVEVDGTSFHPGSIESNSDNSSNQGRAVGGSFLVNVAESKAIRYFGCKSDIFIWTQIKILR